MQKFLKLKKEIEMWQPTKTYPTYEIYLASFGLDSQAIINAHNSGQAMICSGQIPSDDEGRSDWSKTWIQIGKAYYPVVDQKLSVFVKDEKHFQVQVREISSGGLYFQDEQGVAHDVRETYCVAVPVNYP
jgi:hypothetical protein